MSLAIRRRGALLCALAAAALILPSIDDASALKSARDRTKPVIDVKTPTAGATVSGTLSGSVCEAMATDNVAVNRVEFSVDGAMSNADNVAPYNCAWDTSKSSPGQHTFTARAVDTSGNSSSESVTVTVAAPAPSPTPTVTPSQPPIASFSVAPSPALWGSPVTFSSNGSCADAPCSYRWSHGQASSTEEIEAGAAQPNTEAQFTYRYDGYWEGPATVILQVTDKDGQSATATRTFSLEQPPSPTPSPSPSPASTPTPTPTPSPTASPSPSPAPSGGFPDASNTGVPAGSSLTTVSGNVTLSTAGQVYADRQVNGCITVNAMNVTIRRVRVTCTGLSAIWSGSTGLVVEDSEIDCKDAVGHTGLTPGNFTARRVNAHGCDNTVWATSNTLIEDSFIHDVIDYDPITDPHTDGVQFNENRSSNVTLRHNTIYGNYVNQDSFGNAAVQIGYLPTNVTITNNLMAGGGYTLRCQKAVDATGLTITNNRFSTRFVSTVGGFGPTDGLCDNYADAYTGNVIHETGAPLAG